MSASHATPVDTTNAPARRLDPAKNLLFSEDEAGSGEIENTQGSIDLIGLLGKAVFSTSEGGSK